MAIEGDAFVNINQKGFKHRYRLLWNLRITPKIPDCMLYFKKLFSQVYCEFNLKTANTIISIFEVNEKATNEAWKFVHFLENLIDDHLLSEFKCLQNVRNKLSNQIKLPEAHHTNAKRKLIHFEVVEILRMNNLLHYFADIHKRKPKHITSLINCVHPKKLKKLRKRITKKGIQYEEIYGTRPSIYVTHLFLDFINDIYLE